jgi:uncharacterized protein YceH (UPF0502 family)
MQLAPYQLRVLGSLIEKEITTPENYPLSLNALINACNQRSSRDPVLDLTEEDVRQALHALEDLALVSAVRDARVPKYEHRIRTVLNLRRDETALLCLLLLRGPQTPGELRSRADRMFSFDDLASVVATLDRLAARSCEPDPSYPNAPATGPLTAVLPRQPGSREARYTHLLGDPASIPAASSYPRDAEPAPSHLNTTQRITELEDRLIALQDLVQALEQRMHRLEDASPQHGAPSHPAQNPL